MSDLHAAAAAAGLRRAWEDADGRQHRVADEVLAAVLDRLDTTAPTTPFLSTVAGRSLAIAGLRETDAELALEDGSVLPVRIDAAGRVPPITAIGYHRLRAGGTEYAIAVAPPRCPQPTGRSWGVSVQVPALVDDRHTPFGDFGALAAAVKALGQAGAQAVAISPSHALFPADPTRFSPYAPSSRLFHNVLLADPTPLGVGTPAVETNTLIDWREAARHRLASLRQAYDEAGEGTRAALAAYRHERGAALEAHARFDALHARLGGSGWPAWGIEYHDPHGAAVQRFAAEHANDVAFYAFLQWLAEQGLAAAQQEARAAMGIGLIADLAVGTDRGGSHGWSRPGDLLSGLTIGAPPDPLGPDGQNWGIAALDPFSLARTGFAAFIDTIRTALRHAGGIRVDHAIGLNRLWVIPDGAGADEGVYLDMPAEALKHIVAIEAHRAGAIVIAEDLGTVPDGLRDDLAERGMLGMRVLPFERDAAGAFVSPRQWDETAVAMTGTHDTPTVAGWWKARDLDWRERLGATPDRETRVHERQSLWRALGGSGPPPEEPPLTTVIAEVAAAPTPLAIVPFEDLLGLEEQPNLPGTIDEHPNWRRRMPDSTDRLLSSPEVAARTRLLTAERPG